MFKPIHSLVTVKLDPKPTKSAGGVDLPETASASFRTGVVQAAGEGPQDQNGKYVGLPVKPGDRVVIGVQKDRANNIANLGTIRVDGDDVVLVNIHDIWGTCEKAAGSDQPELRIVQA